jgi:PAS domain-containing protein
VPAGQPIWVVDRDDVIRFANPTALAALGYEDVGGLVGLHSHETSSSIRIGSLDAG